MKVFFCFTLELLILRATIGQEDLPSTALQASCRIYASSIDLLWFSVKDFHTSVLVVTRTTLLSCILVQSVTVGLTGAQRSAVDVKCIRA